MMMMMMMMIPGIFTYGTNTYRYSFRRYSVRTPWSWWWLWWWKWKFDYDDDLTLMMMLWWQRYVDVNITRGEIVHNTVTPLPPASHLPPVGISPDLRFRRRFPHTSRFPQVSSWFPPDFSEYFSRTRELWFPRTSWFPSDVPAQLDFSERNAISRRLPLIKMTWKD